MRAPRWCVGLALLLAWSGSIFAIPTLPRPNVHVVDGGIGSILYRCTLNAPTLYEYFAYDALGSTVALTLNDGSVESSDLYEAFGSVVSTWGTSSNNRLSHTKERDLSLGLDNHGFRYYDPVIGRYITRDPLGYGDGLNVYLYVHDNPINHIDPLGLSEENGLVNDVEEVMATQPVQSQPARPVMRYPQTDEEYIQQVMENRNRMVRPNAYTKAVAGCVGFGLDTLNSFDPVTPYQRLSSGVDDNGRPLTFQQKIALERQFANSVFTLTTIVAGFVPEGEGFSFSRTLAKTEGVNAAEGPVVIGETMTRVEAAAAKIPGSKILNDMPDFRAMGMNADQVTSSMMQYNRQWILDQMRSGRQIIDIGADANRASPSIFYQMEQNMLKNYQKLHPDFNSVVKP